MERLVVAQEQHQKNISGYTSESESQIPYFTPQISNLDQILAPAPKSPAKRGKSPTKTKSPKKSKPKPTKAMKKISGDLRYPQSKSSLSLRGPVKSSGYGNQKIPKTQSSTRSLKSKSSSKTVPTSTTGLPKQYSSLEYLQDLDPATLSYTHTVEGLPSYTSKLHREQNRGKPKVKYSDDQIYQESIQQKIPASRNTFPKRNNSTNSRKKSSVSSHSSLRFSTKSIPSIKIERIDPDLNQSYKVDTRNLGYQPATGKDIKNPKTGRLVIQMTKASRMRLEKAKSEQSQKTGKKGKSKKSRKAMVA